MTSAGTVEVEAAATVGLGAAIGVPTGVDGSAAATVAAGGAAGREDAAGAGPLDELVELVVTVMMPTACVLVVEFVAVAVRLTHAGPLDGALIPALRVNNDGVTSVPSDPS